MNQKERMLASLPYHPGMDGLPEERRRAQRLCWEYNQLAPDDEAGRSRVLCELVGSHEGDFWIEQGFRCDYGYNIHLGADFYANYNCVILDCAPVTFGKRVMLAPNVTITTASHPLDAQERCSCYEFAKPVTVGDDVWLGANATVLPGVSIGAGTVVGAGSVVTRDLPARVVAVGNPCRVLRPITSADRGKYGEIPPKMAGL